MKRTISYLTVSGIVCALFLTGCCRSRPCFSITEEDMNMNRIASVGDVFEVRLKAQLGTGYGWKVVSDNRELKQLGDPEQTPSDEVKVGGFNYQIFRFRAVRRGKSVLKMDYVQPWEKDFPPAKTFSVTVQVE